MAKRLIVNADDYGRSRGVTRGIILAHQAGIVTSTTLMMNMAWVDLALEMANQNPNLGVGVHLVFTLGRPVSPVDQVPSLVDEQGQFWSQSVLREDRARIDLGELRLEFEAQIARFRQSDRQPTHLDCHHFLYLDPLYFRVYCDVAQAQGLPIRMPLPVTVQERDSQVIDMAEQYGVTAMDMLAIIQQDVALARERKLRYPDRFISEFFGRSALSATNLKRILDSVGDGLTELMTHPAFPDNELLDSSGYVDERMVEMTILVADEVRETVRLQGIDLVNFGVLA
ncbi:MAG: carbohydrate deacetylase [Chloroflexi bacterium]|nr:carbohydrate deacetylase [Chloroflexota bacterium]MBU1748581.1 carbohydrate deacetylase [Chloroflexota bacterium]